MILRRMMHYLSYFSLLGIAMALRHMGRYLGYLSLCGIAGLFIAGCVIHDAPALGEIAKARRALDDAEKAGAADRSSGKFAALEQRYLQALKEQPNLQTHIVGHTDGGGRKTAGWRSP